MVRIMSYRAKRPCSYPGCSKLVDKGYCDKHKKQKENRGTAHQRGYNYRWSKYSKAFLSRPENVFCKLQLEGCTNIAQCVDHVIAVDGANDSNFWDVNNHQPACLHCNTLKGRKTIKGKGKAFERMDKR
jgi:5-methylcytosine-specific restriction protein A